MIEWKAWRDPDGDDKKVKVSLKFPGQHFGQESNYDPGIGRYIQSDPTGILSNHDYLLSVFGRQAEVRGLKPLTERELNHSYGYVKQNPLRFVDPTGLRNPSPAEIVRPCINRSSAINCISCCRSTYRFNPWYLSICAAECHYKEALGGFNSGGE